eukprot:TRINITY_DN6652_c0_g1_i1.p1 TRINITY_DN6652_c0_g1~~TRINITY_DN6652_c0_g1_i1.p1  ORF type:complete len:297 (-),score=56.40 TRINITY_DN6652_c0_g1_i1:335-1225(-)
MVCGSLVEDIYVIETTDTLQSLSDDCFDDDAAYKLDGDQLSPADAFSTDVLPEAFLNSAIALEKALSHLESAIELFANEASELSSYKCPALAQFVSVVAALRPQLANEVVPEIAVRLADSMALKLEPAVNATVPTSCPTISTCVKRTAESCWFRACRPPSLTLNSHQDVPKATLFPHCGVVTGSPRRLRDPLVEVIKHSKKADVACTLAVWGINEMGSEALGSIRAYLETSGEVEMVTRPRIAPATDFALVKMKTKFAVDGIMSTGERHTLDGVEFFVRRLLDFVADLDAQPHAQA